MALTTKFSAIDKAIITCTGNTLVICGDSTALDNNTSDLITFDNLSTRDWTKCGSTANLSLLDNSTILYAELVWYSTVKSNLLDSPDLQGIQNSAIAFTTPSGTIELLPEYSENYTWSNGSIDCLRSANITNIIKDNLNGNYTVSKIPTSIPSQGLSNTRAGFYISVIYRNDIFETEKILYLSGIANISSNTPFETILNNFELKDINSLLKGNLFFAATNATPLAINKVVNIGPDLLNLIPQGNEISTPSPEPATAPNNPINNFFSSQINLCNPTNSNNGLININGTNGNNNCNGFLPLQKVGARNKWDITNIDIGSSLSKTQKDIAVKITNDNTTSFNLLSLAANAKVSAPNIVVKLSTNLSNEINPKIIYVNNEIIYSLEISNLGNISANNFKLSTILAPNGAFVENSFKLNGQTIIGADITKGVNINTINAGAVYKVLFSVKIISLPENNVFSAYVDYNYSFNYSTAEIYTNYCKSNIVNSKVSYINISISKESSSNSTAIGETISYKVTVANTGTEALFSIYFQDIINSCCSFIVGSVIINGIAHQDLNPNVGFYLETLLPTENIIITFLVRVNSLPPSKALSNQGKITYSYVKNSITLTETQNSNTVEIIVTYKDIISELCSNNDYPNIGDKVTYTLSLTNIGNTPVTDYLVLEKPVYGQSFIENSVFIDGTNYPGFNPFLGFTIPSINPQQNVIINYDTSVYAISPDRLIENIAQVPYEYQFDPSSPIISIEQDSNKVVTISSFVKLTILEAVDKAFAIIGDTLYYSVKITNNGNIDAINCIFTSLIQAESEFIPNSVAINGIIKIGYNPNLGFSLDTICPNETVLVTYSAKVISLPTPNIIYNNSQLTYEFFSDPNSSAITDTVFSNTVSTVINSLSFSIIKSADRTYAQVGDSFFYTTTILNTGTVSLTDINFIDTLNQYIIFKTGEIFINGVKRSDLNPEIGFYINNLAPQEKTTITFEVLVVAIPPIGFITNNSTIIYSYKLTPNSPTVTSTALSNTVYTYISDGQLTILKIVDKAFSTLEDTLTYSFVISNIGSTALSNLSFTDIIPTEASFVVGSVIVNNVSKPEFNPMNSFPLDNIAVGGVINLSFTVIIKALPTPNVLINNSSVNYSYLPYPNTPLVTKTAISNNVTTIINLSSTVVLKTVNKAFATLDDTLIYTISIENSGTVNIYDVYFTDTIASGATFIDGSVFINNINYPTFNPNKGFYTPNISFNGTLTISFTVKVTSIPNKDLLENSASINYLYKLNPNDIGIVATNTSNTVTTKINYVNISNVKAVDKEYATIDDILTYVSVISNTGNIDITDVDFVDLIPPALEFVDGTVKINNISYPSFNPNSKFPIGTLSPNNLIQVEFKVKVIALPLSGFVINRSTINFRYLIDPVGQYFYDIKTSNDAKTFIRVGDCTITKESDRTDAIPYDVINYSFQITNTGNVQLTNLRLLDVISPYATFNAGSVIINGISEPSLDPNKGFMLPDLGVGTVDEVSFSVTVLSVPPNYDLLNSGTLNFSYYINPLGPPITNTITTNETSSVVTNTILSATVTVNKTVTILGTHLIYDFIITNRGDTYAFNIFFTNILVPYVTFEAGTVVVNGISQPSFNPITGFPIPDLDPGASDNISFHVLAVSTPPDNTIVNSADVTYDYSDIPKTLTISAKNLISTENIIPAENVFSAQAIISAKVRTNIVKTILLTANLSIEKFVDKTHSTIGDLLTYSFSIKNVGTIIATSLSFIDLIQLGATFRASSVFINNINFTDYNPNLGFPLHDLNVNDTIFISFIVNVTSLPPSGKIDNFGDITFSYQATPDTPIYTTTTSSNIVRTIINAAILSVAKAVDKLYGTIDSILKYTFSISNSGNVPAIQCNLVDILQSNISFNIGSVTIEGFNYPDYNPNSGFVLPNINPNNTITVSFLVTVASLPLDRLINNYCVVNFTFVVAPTIPLLFISAISNIVSTIINLLNLTVLKSTSLQYATLRNTILYTISISNTSTLPVTSVNFLDLIPSGLTFINNSVAINQIPQPGLDPNSSFTLGTINPGTSVSVSFRVIVTSLPSPPIAINNSIVTFTYKLEPNSPSVTSEVISNNTNTEIRVNNLNITKAVDKAYATIDDILTYSFIITNNGNIDLYNLFFIDVLSDMVQFNTGSVLVDNISQPNYNPIIGFNLNNLQVQEKIAVSFTVTVKTSATEGYVLDNALVNYSYKINPNGPDLFSFTNSNTVTTLIKIATISISKAVNLLYATLGDTLIYTIVINNTSSSLNFFDLFFIDILSFGATFIENSVIVNSKPEPNLNPIDGFYISTLTSGKSITIKFEAKVTSIENISTIENYSKITGFYIIDPLGPNYQISGTSNTVITKVIFASLTLQKAVDKLTAKVGDTLTYSNLITNNGTTPLTSVIFTDILQQEISFVSGTVKINNISYAEANPTVGIQIGDLAVNQSVLITFDVKINLLPNPPIVYDTSQVKYSYKINPSDPIITKTIFSNTVYTSILYGELKLVKIVDKNVASLEEILNYTIYVSNTANSIAYNPFFKDILSAGAVFNLGTVSINSVPKPDLDPIAGFYLDNIPVGNTVIINFTATVKAIPPNNVITNGSSVYFSYIVPPDPEPIYITAFSNITITTIAVASLVMVKTVDKEFAVLGDILTYTVVSTNNGNVNIIELFFIDQTPANTEFIIGSITVDGQSYPNYNPAIGFSLGDVLPGESITVVYQVKIVTIT